MKTLLLYGVVGFVEGRKPFAGEPRENTESAGEPARYCESEGEPTIEALYCVYRIPPAHRNLARYLAFTEGGAEPRRSASARVERLLEQSRRGDPDVTSDEHTLSAVKGPH
ncbi:MAG TPA: hypothetical protein VMB48_00595 [Steroidobacteraceae bacterium]|nr:hypothetical protein [Steroidobacteraceae bacterium]